MKHVKEVYFSGTWNENDFNVRRILQSHGTCQVRGGVSSEAAAKCDNDRLEIFLHNASFD